MTAPDVLREQARGSGQQYHNRRRDLTWAEVMPEPLDWDEWCMRRHLSECQEAAVRCGETGAKVR
jgi:hypothetical protein